MCGVLVLEVRSYITVCVAHSGTCFESIRKILKKSTYMKRLGGRIIPTNPARQFGPSLGYTSSDVLGVENLYPLPAIDSRAWFTILSL